MTGKSAVGIDFGTVRIGVAASDPLGILASPVETIDAAGTARTGGTDPLARIAAIVAARHAGTVVVGLPLRMDGTEGTAAAKVRAFTDQLQAALPAGVRIVLIDERLTTQEAHRLLDQASSRRRRNPRATKGVIDQASAVLILQDYLDNACSAPESPADDEPQ
ncbi:Holliday junction resolvase RuvX [soil metagenome]